VSIPAVQGVVGLAFGSNHGCFGFTREWWNFW